MVFPHQAAFICIFQDIFSDVEGAVTETASTSAGDTLLLHQLILGLPPAGQITAYNHCREDTDRLVMQICQKRMRSNISTHPRFYLGNLSFLNYIFNQV